MQWASIILQTLCIMYCCLDQIMATLAETSGVARRGVGDIKT